MCHNSIYVSSYYYICPHATTYVSSYYYMCSYTAIYWCAPPLIIPLFVSSYYYVCVLMLLHVCLHSYILGVVRLRPARAQGGGMQDSRTEPAVERREEACVCVCVCVCMYVYMLCHIYSYTFHNTELHETRNARIRDPKET
jgi:hypothetical protein